MDAILFSARNGIVEAAIDHLGDPDRCVYWSLAVPMKANELSTPIVGLIHVKGDQVKYRATIDRIIPYDPAHDDDPEVKPTLWRDEKAKKSPDRRPLFDLVISQIVPFSYETTSLLKKINGEPVKQAPQGYVRILLPDPLRDFVEADREIARQRVLAEQATRPGQQQFSATIRKNYSGRCAITGCTTAAALQAAHIRLQKNSDANSPQNGLLLRADIHALFDALLITLSEDGTRVEVSAALTDPSYAFLRDAVLFQPPPDLCPSADNIRDHRNRFNQHLVFRPPRRDPA